MSNNKSLLEAITDNIKDGVLPDTFSLPKEDDNSDPNKIKFADGAMDGIGIYHMVQPEITDELMQTLADAFKYVGDTPKAMKRMSDFFAKIPPISGIDTIQRFIIDNSQLLDAQKVYMFAVDCVYSTDVNMVKLGLMIIEIFNEPDEQVKKIIRTLGLSDEFTIFSVFNMLGWENGNQEIFELAQKVHGWGRIHAVARIEPETQEIKDWLLREGIANDVVPDYSALDVYEKVGIDKLLKEEIYDSQLNQIANVLLSMFDEGPVSGISALSEEEATDMLGYFISQAEIHSATLDICNLMLTISEDERFSAFTDKCSEYLNSTKCKTLIGNELDKGRGIRLAKAVGIPYKENIFSHLKTDFNSGYSNCGALLDDDAYRKKVVDVFRTSLPLKTMIGEPTTAGGYFDKYADYNKLAYLIQLLKEYPLCGTDLVAIALRTPIIQCRIQALNAIAEWCKVKKCSIKELSDELYQAVEYLKQAEVDDKVKELFTKYNL
ncbi:MAG: hypothetical protein K2J39_09950 [Ruminococcus sp.]|nr:hypothetical protein [Ruminococcus sp.]